MTTTVSHTIGTTGDYSLPQAWADACPADLTAVDEVWEGLLQKQTFTASSGPIVTISGITTDGTRFVRLTTAAGAGFRDNASIQSTPLRYNATNGAAFDMSSGYATALINSTSFFALSGLQIQTTSATGVALSAGNGATIADCIIETKAFRGVALTQASANNCVFVARGGQSEFIEGTFCTGIFSCTIVSPSGVTAAAAAVRSNYTSPLPIYNSAICGFTALATGNSTFAYTTCVTDIASPPTGCTTAAFDTTLFTNVTDGTHDLRIPSASSALVNAGTTDTAHSLVDIAGTSRPQGAAYDIGCWEYKASGAAGTGSLTFGALTLSAAGSAPLTASSTPTLAAVTASAAATAPATASSTAALAAATLAGSVAMPAAAALGAALDPVLVAGTSGQVSLGALTTTLAGLGVSADAISMAFATGDMSAVLAALSLGASAVSTITAGASATLAPASVAASATVPALGRATVDLFALGLSAEIHVGVGASLAALLRNATLLAFNAVPVTLGIATATHGVNTMIDCSAVLTTGVTCDAFPATRIAVSAFPLQ